MNLLEIDPSAVPQRILNTGERMPAIGLGTFGSDKYSSTQVADAVDIAIRIGFRLLDCASVYQNEREIGLVLNRIFSEGIVSRKDLFITSKVWNDRHHEVAAACRQSLTDLQCDELDLYLVHWPFPNIHVPGCGGDYRNPDARPFDPEAYLDTWRQCEKLVDQGLVRHIGMSNMTIPKLKAILPHCRIQPAALEMELHPSFQQQELFDYATSHGIVPIGYCPIGSPSRPERDRTPEDIADTQMPEITQIAQAHGIHPALVCLKWAVQRGQIPIPFSVKEPQLRANLRCTTESLLTDEEMDEITQCERNCRLVKGQVFLWEGAGGWEDLWDPTGELR